MLKIECPKCAAWIPLFFDCSGETVKCQQCSHRTTATDIYAAGGPFLLHKDILVKNLNKYKQLIAETEKEMLDLQKKAPASRPHEVSARSLALFVSDLKELLDGCRDTVRHRFKGVRTQYTIDNKKHYGSVLNLSTSGICIESSRTTPVNRLWNDATVHFKGQRTPPFNVAGKVMWLSKNGLMGIRFINVDRRVVGLIKDYIVEKTLQYRNRPEDDGTGLQ